MSAHLLDFSCYAAPIMARHGIYQLTDREREVMERVKLGSGNKAIAIDLGISEDTVKRHMTHITQKLGCSTRSEAVWKYLNQSNDDMKERIKGIAQMFMDERAEFISQHFHEVERLKQIIARRDETIRQLERNRITGNLGERR